MQSYAGRRRAGAILTPFNQEKSRLAADAPFDPFAPGALAFIGYGEAASAFLAGWRKDFPAVAVRAHDIKTDAADPAVRARKAADYAAGGVDGRATLAEALAGARAIFSLVTADQAEVAADAAARCIGAAAFYLDCNSCSPQAKRRSAEKITAAGGRYVDVAVMAPVHPKLSKTPVLLSGPEAEAAKSLFDALTMNADLAGQAIGEASAIKMIRSVMIKGLEALAAECVLAGRRAGVEDRVLASLDETFPGFGWQARASYMLERVMTHGVRRAAEMREVAATVTELGLDPAMATATVRWQQAIGDLRLDADAAGATAAARADAILAALAPIQEA